MAKIKTLWDIGAGLPHPTAWVSDSRGNSRPRGKYIVWPMVGGKGTSTDTIRCCVPNGNLAAEKCYIARIHVPYMREATYDYGKFRQFPVDMSDKKTARRVEKKLRSVLQSLGVAYINRAGLLQATTDIASASWFVNFQGKEGIAVNPYIVLQSPKGYLTRMVKKQVVHRALYRNLNELSNKLILNFMLDVLSMRVIAETPYGKIDKVTVRMCERLFNPRVYKKFPLLALTDASLTKKQVKNRLPATIADVWLMLYETDDKGFLPPISNVKPSTLYFKIKSMIDDIVIEGLKNGAHIDSSVTNYPFNVQPSNDDNNNGNSYNDNDIASEPDRNNAALNEATRKSMIPRRFRNRMGYSNSVTNFWDKQIVQKKDFVDDKLKEVAKKWRTEKMLEDMEGKLEQIMGKDEVVLKPYPEELTYDGQLFVSLGISSPDCLPLYWNKDDNKKNNRKKVAAFFDLSPSMTNLFPYMVRLLEGVEENCDVVFSRNLPAEEGGGTARGAYGFAGSVTTLTEEDLEVMKKGKLKAGSSTCFNAILEHVFTQIEEDEIDIVLCFTDGLSKLTDENVKQFNETGRQFHNIYMTEYSGHENDRTKVTSDLDKLNGDSYTLCLPPVDVNTGDY